MSRNEFGIRFKFWQVEDLARHLGEPPELIVKVSQSIWAHVTKWEDTTMKHGKPKLRIFYSPDRKLKRLQRKIDRLILRRVSLPESIHGYRRGHSPYTNAKLHAGQPMLGKHDLKNHYPNIHHKRVYALYCKLGISACVASILTRLTTADSHVPQGFSTSPSLSNLITAKLARRLEGLGSSIRSVPSLYADDIAMSGGHGVKRAEKLITRIVRQEGFKLNKAKTEWKRSSEDQEVTGYRIDSGHPTIPPVQREDLLTILRQCAENGPAPVACDKGFSLERLRNHLVGKINRFRVTPNEFHALNTLFQEIHWPPQP